MAFISRACASFQKRILFCKDFTNSGRILSYITHNDYSCERFPVTYKIKYFSTKGYEGELKEKTEIYHGNLTKQIRNLKIFTLLTSASGLLGQPFFYLKAVETGNIGILVVFACIGFLTVSTPLLIDIITKKYVTHLYYDAKEDKYIAHTYNLFVRTKELVFTPSDVVVPDITGIFTSCIIKGTPLFLDQKFFHNSSHYIRIMGYDKPIDFKLNNNTTKQAVTIDAECKDKK